MVGVFSIAGTGLKLKSGVGESNTLIVNAAVVSVKLHVFGLYAINTTSYGPATM